MFRSITMLSSSRSSSCTAVVVNVQQSTRSNITEDSNLQRETGYSRKLSAHHPYLDVSQSWKILRIMFIDLSECKKPGLQMKRGRRLAPKPELILHDYVVCFLYKHPWGENINGTFQDHIWRSRRNNCWEPRNGQYVSCFWNTTEKGR